MQVYAIRYYNFMRFGDKNNSLVLDILPEDRIALDDDRLTLDEIYDRVKEDPIAYIAEVQKRGVTNLMSIAGMVGDNYDKSNGVGKSTLLEGICYAHYNQIVRNTAHKGPRDEKVGEAGQSVVTKINGEKPSSVKESYVEEFFEEDGLIYRIKRGRTFTAKTNSPMVEFECLGGVDASADTRNAHATRNVSKSIEEVNGMDYDVFVNGIMFGQSDAGKFLTGTDKIRKQMVIKVLRLEKIIQGYLENIRNRKNAQERAVETLKAKIEMYTEKIEEGDSIAELQAKIQQCEALIKTLDKEAKEYNAKIEKLSASEPLKEEARIRSEGKKLQDDLKSKINGKESQVKEWRSLFESVKTKNKANNEKRDAAKTKVTEIAKQIAAKEKAVADFDIDVQNRAIEKAAKAKEVRPKYVDGIAKHQADKEAVIKDVATNQSELNRLKKELSGLKSQLEEVGNVAEFVCDKCKSKVTREHLEGEAKSLEAQVREISSELAKNSESGAKMTQGLNQLKERLEMIDKHILNEEKAKSNIKTHEDNKARLVELKASLEERNQIIEECDKEEESIREQGTQYNNKIKEINAKYDDEIADMKSKVEALGAELKKILAAAKKVQDEIDECKRNLEINAETKSDHNLAIGSHRKAIENVKDTLKAIENLKKDVEAGNRSFNRLLVLESIFGLEGIQTRIVRRYLPLLNSYIKDVLDILTKGEMRVTVFINKRSQVDICIEGGTASEYKLLSGGEKMVVRLATDIGMALLTFSRSTREPELICLDEIFGPLDNSHTEAVFRLLKKLQAQFSRVLVISHKAEINDLIKHRIVVEKDAGMQGRSKIRMVV